MIKTSTKKSSDTSKNDNMLPSDQVIRNIINYSKALKVYKSKSNVIQLEQILN